MGARQVIVEGSLKVQSILYKVSKHCDTNFIDYEDPNASAKFLFYYRGDALPTD